LILKSTPCVHPGITRSAAEQGRKRVNDDINLSIYF